MKKFQSLTGMKDILPDDFKYFDKIHKVGEKLAFFYNYSRVEPPIIEDTRLFLKGTGQNTEVVEKQMYTFESKSKKSITLRPEGTPGVVRAYIEHGMSSLPSPVKIYSYGPVFRYERPQAGRYRQFNQFNFDVFGDKSYVMDVEIVQIAYNFLKELGLKNIVIEINSLGNNKCRTEYNKVLKKYLKKQSNLCKNCLFKFNKNPLRFLDCKEAPCQIAKLEAPKIIDYLEDDSKKDFITILEVLDSMNIPYSLNNSLVRGLDYYTKTVFELSIKGDDGKTLSLGGGGRYDNMIKLFKGGDVPACGFGIGIERVVAEIKKIKEIPDIESTFYLAQLGLLAKNNCFKLLEKLRKANLTNIAFSLQKNSLGSQLTQANKLNVKYVLILGEEEARAKKIIIRDMKSGEQEVIKQQDLIKKLKKLAKINNNKQ